MSYKAGIIEAITELKDRNGSSMVAIKKYMQGKQPAEKKWQNATFLNALKTGVAAGDFVQNKASYKLSADFKKKAAAAAKPKKAPVKKAAAPKKKAAVKKTTATKKPATAKKATTSKKTTATKKPATAKKTATKAKPATAKKEKAEPKAKPAAKKEKAEPKAKPAKKETKAKAPKPKKDAPAKKVRMDSIFQLIGTQHADVFVCSYRRRRPRRPRKTRKSKFSLVVRPTWRCYA